MLQIGALRHPKAANGIQTGGCGSQIAHRIHTYIYISIYTSTHTYIYIYTSTYLYTSTYIYIYTSTYIYILITTYTPVTIVRLYVFRYTYTQTHGFS